MTLPAAAASSSTEGTKVEGTEAHVDAASSQKAHSATWSQRLPNQPSSQSHTPVAFTTMHSPWPKQSARVAQATSSFSPTVIGKTSCTLSRSPPGKETRISSPDAASENQSDTGCDATRVRESRSRPSQTLSSHSTKLMPTPSVAARPSARWSALTRGSVPSTMEEACRGSASSRSEMSTRSVRRAKASVCTSSGSSPGRRSKARAGV
mmetsp:Transcript_18040/g.52630  ORF Transcript_18040/g.52630 Transcript_18040/m.52630 type:complete len:208 (+) Transcript_18040:154-777(+)